jgi:ATP synthase protein I
MRALPVVAVTPGRLASRDITLVLQGFGQGAEPHTPPMDIRAKAYRIVSAQLAVAALVSLGFWLFSGATAASSAFAGGVISAAGSLIFARWLIRAEGRAPRAFAHAFYVGEGMKLVVTVALFWAALAQLEMAAAPLLITYAVTLIVYWLALLPEMPGAVPNIRQ